MLSLRRGREHAWLDESIEYLLKKLNYRFIQVFDPNELFRSFYSLVKYVFCSEETKRKTSGDEVYYTRSRIERLVVSIITVMILVLLVVPIYVLYHLTDHARQHPNITAISIGTLLVCTLAFSAVLALFTRAKRHEILGAAAAYCAVLVVFLGNVQAVDSVAE